MNRISAVSVIALALAGCVNMAPDHERPALASPAVYAPEYRPDGTVTAGTLSYSEWFTDQRLVALIDAAVANNRDLIAATADQIINVQSYPSMRRIHRMSGHILIDYGQINLRLRPISARFKIRV